MGQTDSKVAPQRHAVDALLDRTRVKDNLEAIRIDRLSESNHEKRFLSTFDIQRLIDSILSRNSASAQDETSKIDEAQLTSVSSSSESWVADLMHANNRRHITRELPLDKHKNSVEQLLSSASHPISIAGDFTVSSTLVAVDNSPYRNSFPISRYEWYVSDYLFDNQTFSGEEIREADKIILADRYLGRYVKLIGYRVIEFTSESLIGSDAQLTNIFSLNQKNKLIAKVQSYCSGGPIGLKNSPFQEQLPSLRSTRWSNIPILDNARFCKRYRQKVTSTASLLNKIRIDCFVVRLQFETEYLSFELVPDSQVRDLVPAYYWLSEHKSDFRYKLKYNSFRLAYVGDGVCSLCRIKKTKKATSPLTIAMDFKLWANFTLLHAQHFYEDRQPGELMLQWLKDEGRNTFPLNPIYNL